MDMTLEQEEREAEKEQAKMWIEYLSMTFAQQPLGKPDAQYKRAKQDFENALMPKTKTPQKKYEWDFEREERERLEGR